MPGVLQLRLGLEAFQRQVFGVLEQPVALVVCNTSSEKWGRCSLGLAPAFVDGNGGKGKKVRAWMSTFQSCHADW
jgi:hypothetical protein